MQTTYYNTHRMIWTESKNKVVDLDAYRRYIKDPPNLQWKNEAELAEAMANWTRRAKALAFIFGEEDEP